MLSVLSLNERLQSETLEGVAITSCLRWLIFTLIFPAIGAFVGVAAEMNDLRFPLIQTFTLFLYLGFALAVVMMILDLVKIRRHASKWESQRIHTIKIMRQMPLLLIFFIPIYLFANEGTDSHQIFKWAADMLWAFSFLSALFYLVYFLLLLIIFQRPKVSSIIGFALSLAATALGVHSRLEESASSQQSSIDRRPMHSLDSNNQRFTLHSGKS